MLAAGLAAAVDPEKSLWVPGRKLISIPKPVSLPTPWLLLEEFHQRYSEPTAVHIANEIDRLLMPGDIITIAGRYQINPRNRREMTGLQKYRVTGKTEDRMAITLEFA